MKGIFGDVSLCVERSQNVKESACRQSFGDVSLCVKCLQNVKKNACRQSLGDVSLCVERPQNVKKSTCRQSFGDVSLCVERPGRTFHALSAFFLGNCPVFEGRTWVVPGQSPGTTGHFMRFCSLYKCIFPSSEDKSGSTGGHGSAGTFYVFPVLL